MPIKRNGETYYTMEETSKILDEKIKKRAKKIAKDIVSKNKLNRLNK